MLCLGEGYDKTCRGMTRRHIFELGGSAALGLSLAEALPGLANPSAGAKAENVILFWLSGGHSQHETFDPKPDQPIEIRGPYAPVETNVSGIRISSLLPQLSRQADKYCIVRSMTHENPNHGYVPMMNGGGETPTGYPTVMNKFAGGEGVMPPFVNLGGLIDLGAGGLGAAFAPVQVSDPASGKVSLPDFDPPNRVDANRISRRRRLVTDFDSLREQVEASEYLRARDGLYERALAMLATPKVRDAFDLTKEPRKLREQYGASIFGQSCLMARRLIEAGTRIVQVAWTERGGAGWDTHGTVLSGIFEMEQYLTPRFDQGLAMLLEDLADHGLLKSTLVVCISEFGRTPRINAYAGRDHWPHVASVLLAGGGVPGGTVVGASDAQGGYPAHRPVRPGDLAATLYRLLGLSPLTDDRLRPYVKGEVVPEIV
jgi:hypothetical protein